MKKRIGNRKTVCRMAVSMLLGAAVCSFSFFRGGILSSFAAEQEEQTVLYGIGSTSKVITAAAVMKLYEEGSIDIDAPLTAYIPEFVMADERYQSITPRMLLNHSSGLQGSTLTGTMMIGTPDTSNHDMLLSRLRSQRLKADPGAFEVYCNDGFTLAEILVERVTGQTFTDYVEQEMAGPMGLSKIKTPQSPGVMKLLAPVYDSETGIRLPAEAPNVIGSGGIYATAEELCSLSQIFMKDQGKASGVLSRSMAEEMEESTYDKRVNPDGLDTSLSYGLGWDSVNAYPFSRYGIRALVKGGDTSYYHGSLTVLPEENISCAVLSSGGGSATCQLAVQEILMEYLEEIGRITREEESVLTEGKNPSSALPADYPDVSGWYAGDSMMEVKLDQNGMMTASTEGTGHDRKQNYVYHDKDGVFYSTEGSYMNLEGGLTKSSNGKTGRTGLRFQTDEKTGYTYLMAQSSEMYPGLGTSVLYLPVAQKLEGAGGNTAGSSRSVLPSDQATWQGSSEKEFYLVSEPYASSFYLSRYQVKPRLLSQPDGYLVFHDSALKMARTDSDTHASFFLQVPGQVGRDLSDYTLSEKNGKTYLHSVSWTYIREDGLSALPDGNCAITIGADGEAVWYLIEEAAKDGFVTIKTPQRGAYYIYDCSGKEMKCTASSWTNGEEQEFLLPQKGKIVFAGEPGETFVIERK